MQNFVIHRCQLMHMTSVRSCSNSFPKLHGLVYVFISMINPMQLDARAGWTCNRLLEPKQTRNMRNNNILVRHICRSISTVRQMNKQNKNNHCFQGKLKIFAVEHFINTCTNKLTSNFFSKKKKKLTSNFRTFESSTTAFIIA